MYTPVVLQKFGQLLRMEIVWNFSSKYMTNCSRKSAILFNFFQIDSFSVDPNPVTRHTVFSVVIGGFFYWVSLLCTNQASVQKCMSLKCEKKANIALAISIFGKKKPHFNWHSFTQLMLFRIKLKSNTCIFRIGADIYCKLLHRSYVICSLQRLQSIEIR